MVILEDTKQEKLSIKNIMTKRVISTNPDASVLDAAKLITEHHFDGIPVIDKDGLLLGIVTEYDLIMKTPAINTSLLQNILTDIYSSNDPEVSPKKEETVDISSLKVRDIMNKDPVTLNEKATFKEAVKLFQDHHRVNPIPVINDNGHIVGMVSRFDILQPFNILGYGIKKK